MEEATGPRGAAGAEEGVANAQSSCSRWVWPVGLLRQPLGAPRNTLCAGGGDGAGGGRPASQEGHTYGSLHSPPQTWRNESLGGWEIG